jgi:hypothetical protein
MPVASCSITPAIAGEHSPPAAVPTPIACRPTPEPQQQQQQQQQQQHSAAPVQPAGAWGAKLKQLFSLSGVGTNHPAVQAALQQEQQQQHATASELPAMLADYIGAEQHINVSSFETVNHGSVNRQAEAPGQQLQQHQQLRDHSKQPSDNQDDMQEEQLLGSDAAGHGSSVAQLGCPQHTHADAGDVDYNGHAVQQQQHCGDYSGLPADDEDQNVAQEV